MELLDSIPLDRKAAALPRAVRSEGGDDRLAPARERTPEDRQVVGSIRLIDHEVEDRPVVPQVEPSAEVLGANIGCDPSDPLSIIAKRVAGAAKGGLRDVGYGYIGVAATQEMPCERRGSTTDVHDRGSAVETDRLISSSDCNGTDSYQLTAVGSLSR